VQPRAAGIDGASPIDEVRERMLPFLEDSLVELEATAVVTTWAGSSCATWR
jgi:hypothetical protein